MLVRIWLARSCSQLTPPAGLACLTGKIRWSNVTSEVRSWALQHLRQAVQALQCPAQDAVTLEKRCRHIHGPLFVIRSEPDGFIEVEDESFRDAAPPNFKFKSRSSVA